MPSHTATKRQNQDLNPKPVWFQALSSAPQCCLFDGIKKTKGLCQNIAIRLEEKFKIFRVHTP